MVLIYKHLHKLNTISSSTRGYRDIIGTKTGFVYRSVRNLVPKHKYDGLMRTYQLARMYTYWYRAIYVRAGMNTSAP
jgi:hypothetical protein